MKSPPVSVSLKKLTVLSCAKQEMCNGMIPRGADPGQTLLTLRKTHPAETHSEMETYQLTTKVKKYPQLHCISLTWKVSIWEAEQWITQPASWCHCATLFMLFSSSLEAILDPSLFSFCKQGGILEWMTYFQIYTLLDIVAVPKE